MQGQHDSSLLPGWFSSQVRYCRWRLRLLGGLGRRLFIAEAVKQVQGCLADAQIIGRLLVTVSDAHTGTM